LNISVKCSGLTKIHCTNHLSPHYQAYQLSDRDEQHIGMAKAVMTSLFFFGPFFVLLSMLNLFTREKKKEYLNAWSQAH
jgi:hypothetical protein